MIGDETTASAEWLLIRELLQGRDQAALQRARVALAEMFAPDPLVQTAVHASGDMLVVPGGFPIVVGPGCVGGLGIAGGHYKEDHIVGEKAFEAMKAAASGAKA